MSPPGSVLRKKKDNLCSPGVNGVWAARGYGNKCNRNSYKSSMSVWMLHFMLMPTRSRFGPNITDFVGFSPARLGHEKLEPFSFSSVSTFSITKHHSKSDSPPLPKLCTCEHFQDNRASFCAQENIIWGLHVSSSKATPRPRYFCPKHRAGSLQKYSELVPNIREASCCCQNFTSL